MKQETLGFKQSVQLLYQLGQNVYGKNPNLSKTCLLGALYGQLVKIGALPPQINPRENTNFNFMDQIIQTLNWHEVLEKVKASSFSSQERLILLSTLNLLSDCYRTMSYRTNRPTHYAQQSVNLIRVAHQLS